MKSRARKARFLPPWESLPWMCARSKSCLAWKKSFLFQNPTKWQAVSSSRKTQSWKFQTTGGRLSAWAAAALSQLQALVPLKAGSRCLTRLRLWRPAEPQCFVAEPTSPALPPIHFRAWAKKALNILKKLAKSTVFRSSRKSSPVNIFP